MQKILSDNTLDEQLTKEGFVVIPFLTAEETAGLVNFYNDSHPVAVDGMYATAHVSDIAFRMKMNERIKQVFARAIDETFENCNPLGGSFIAKGKGSRGTLHPHQDWNLVDEDLFRSFNIWVPLVDLNEQNGVIQVLPQSHTWLKTYRSLNIPPTYGAVNDLLWEKMTSLFMKKGQALIYDHRLLHASGENFTDELRLAAVYGIIPQGAKMYYYHKADENTVEVFESSPEFFLYENTFEGPKNLKSVRSFTYQFDFNANQLKAMITGESYNIPEIKPVGIWQKIKQILSI